MYYEDIIVFKYEMIMEVIKNPRKRYKLNKQTNT